MKEFCNVAASAHLPEACSGYNEQQERLRKLGAPPLDLVGELAGKNLACWGAIGQPCHGDVQLRIANASG